jgi:citrate lyase subunit beta/citryl-CoA lyase
MIPRSWLFVPADSDRKLAHSLDSGADAVILDLEDAVSPERKRVAREAAAAFLAAHRGQSTPALWVRVNSVASGLMQEDLAAVMPAAPAGIVLPKPDSVADVWQLDAALGRLEREAGKTAILATATETAVAVTALPGYVKSPERLLALTWGGEDLAAELGAVANRDAAGEFAFTYRVVRSLCQIAAAAAGKAAIETLFPDFRNHAGLAAFAARAQEDGFSGMLAIHPAQVPAINQIFTPSRVQVDYARRVVEAFAAAPGAGVTQLDGRMLDRPHLAQARRVLERAAALGILDRPH